MANINIQTTRTAMPRCYCYTTPTISDHDGWVKIGYTEQDDVEDRIRQQLQTAHIPHHTEWSDVAVFADGRTYFRDSDFPAYLKKQGVERMKPMNGDKKQPEWFRISGDESFTLYSKFRRTKGVLDTVGTIAYELRAEQEQAVSQTFDYFMSHEKGEFLWNAKPRFGKTYLIDKFFNYKYDFTFVGEHNTPASVQIQYPDRDEPPSYRKFVV